MIQSVTVVPGCISCRTCEDTCPKVFKVDPTSQVITDQFAGKETEILQAEALCPVQVIKVEKPKGIQLTFQTAVLTEKKMLTPDIVELTFTSQTLNYKPGQYVALMMHDWKGKFARNYSIAKASDDSFVLNVKLLDKGRGSSVIQKMKTGKKLDFLGPLGTFVLQNNEKEKYFVATGTGLAPFVAMAERLPASVPKTFVIGARFERDLYYIEALKNIPNTKLDIYISQEKTTHKQGRVTDAIAAIPKEAEVYICGNPAMLESVKADLEKQHHPQKNLFHEAFTVSGTYAPLWKEIFINGNIPLVGAVSWLFMLVGLGVFPALLVYRKTQGFGDYDNFLFFGPFQSFWRDVTWRSVVFVMLIRPVSDIFSHSKFLRKLKVFRKPLGILSASIVVFTFLGDIVFKSGYMERFFSAVMWNSWEAAPARISLITAIILLITSNTFSQKNLGKRRKWIQKTSYLYFICGGLVAASFSPLKVYIPLTLWAVLWIGVEIWKKIRQ